MIGINKKFAIALLVLARCPHSWACPDTVFGSNPINGEEALIQKLEAKETELREASEDKHLASSKYLRLHSEAMRLETDLLKLRTDKMKHVIAIAFDPGSTPDQRSAAQAQIAQLTFKMRNEQDQIRDQALKIRSYIDSREPHTARFIRLVISGQVSVFEALFPEKIFQFELDPDLMASPLAQDPCVKYAVQEMMRLYFAGRARDLILELT